MVAITVVINETVQIVERLIIELPVDLNEINKFTPIDPLSFGYSLFQLLPVDMPVIDSSCCDFPTWNAFVFPITRHPQMDEKLNGGQIEVSYDEGVTWSNRGSFENPSRVGTVVPDSAGDRNLGDPWEDTWDTYSQVTVEMYNGATLESRDRQAVLAGANMMLFDGEIRSFSTAVETTATTKAHGRNKVYILTDWMRNQFNTTRNAQPPPGVDGLLYSTVFDLTGPSTVINMPFGDDGVLVRHRARDNRLSVSEDIGFYVDREMGGFNLKPRAVSPLFTLARDAGDNITISWFPVTREPCPQIFAERGVSDTDATTYDIDILSGQNGSVVRTLQVTSGDTVGYPEPAQVIDFGSAQSTIFFTVTRTSTWLDGNSVEGTG